MLHDYLNIIINNFHLYFQMSNGQGLMQQRGSNQMGWNGEQGREYQQNGNQNTDNYYQQQSQHYRQPSYNPNISRNRGSSYDQNGQNDNNGYDGQTYSHDVSNGEKYQQQQPSNVPSS
jgi:hypothetical protein